MPTETVRHGAIVADDSGVIRVNVRSALSEPWQVFVATDGYEACNLARNVAAKLVLLDYHMPKCDGIKACRWIRALPQYASVPIAILTAYDSVELRREAALAGATVVFSKPFSTGALRDAVAALIALGSDTAAQHRIAALAAARSETPAQSLAAGRDMLTVHRKADSEPKEKLQRSLADIMAAHRAQSRF
jgi:CheY-like chemotaxis protein